MSSILWSLFAIAALFAMYVMINNTQDDHAEIEWAAAMAED